MQRRWWMMGLAGLSLLGAMDASADSTVFVKGTVLNFGNFSDTDIEVGDVMKVTFTIRPLLAGDDQRELDESIGEYVDDTQGFTIDVGNGTYSVTCLGTRIFINNNVSNTSQLPPGNDRITLRGIDCEDSRGEEQSDTLTQIQIVDSTGTAIDDDLLTDANVAALLVAVDIFRGGTAGANGLSLTFGAKKIADEDPNTPLPPPVGVITKAKQKFKIKKVVKDKGKDDYQVELLGDGSFSLEPDDPTSPILTGTWTDAKGKGREYQLELDGASEDALLDALSFAASEASGKNQNVTYKVGKPPTVTLTQSKNGALALSLKAKVKAKNDKGTTRKGSFQLKGNGEVEID